MKKRVSPKLSAAPKGKRQPTRDVGAFQFGFAARAMRGPQPLPPRATDQPPPAEEGGQYDKPAGGTQVYRSTRARLAELTRPKAKGKRVVTFD